MAKLLNSKWFFSLLIFFFSLHAVSGSFISMTSTVEEVIVEEDFGKSQISIQNRGDEAAFEVGFSMMLPDGIEAEDVFIGRLDPDVVFDVRANLSVEKDLPSGSYPGILLISYKDGNGFPFSAVTSFNIILRERTTSNVFGIFEDTALKGDRIGKLYLNLRNPDDVPHDVTIKAFLPKELDIQKSEERFNIEAGGEEKISFDVSSFSAISGSTYPVFASITYLEDGSMYSSFAQGVIKIEEDKPIFTSSRLTIAILLLILIFIFYQLGASKWKKQ